MPSHVLSWCLGVVGGLLGGFLGYLIFFWLIGQGFYGLMVPGAFVGLGCGLLSRHRSWARGVLCGLGALGVELYAEWKFAPMILDESFGYMVTHFQEKPGIKLVMLVAGALLGAWFGKDAGPGSPRREMPTITQTPPG